MYDLIIQNFTRHIELGEEEIAEQTA